MNLDCWTYELEAVLLQPIPAVFHSVILFVELIRLPTILRAADCCQQQVLEWIAALADERQWTREWHFEERENVYE